MMRDLLELFWDVFIAIILFLLLKLIVYLWPDGDEDGSPIDPDHEWL